MEKMWCDIIRCQPSFYQRLQLLAANFIYLAQFYIEENNIDELTDLLCTYSKHYSEITDNPDFKTVFKAAENAAYLRVNTDIHQLIDDQWCKAQYRVKRKDLENKILSLKNPREIQSILEDELDLLDTFITDTNINAKSIPRMMYTWITKQLKINEQHLSSTYEPVTKCTPKTQNDESELPPPDEFATNILEEQYKTFTIEVQKYGFGELEKIKCLTKGQLSKLIYLIIKNDSNYAIPMLVFLEYDKHLKTTYGMTQEGIFTHWAKALGKSARAIKGNYNVLKPNSKEDQYRYNSGDFVSKVQEDYDNL
jgi:hypothetical protein